MGRINKINNISYIYNNFSNYLGLGSDGEFRGNAFRCSIKVLGSPLCGIKNYMFI